MHTAPAEQLFWVGSKGRPPLCGCLFLAHRTTWVLLSPLGRIHLNTPSEYWHFWLQFYVVFYEAIEMTLKKKVRTGGRREKWTFWVATQHCGNRWDWCRGEAQECVWIHFLLNRSYLCFSGKCPGPSTHFSGPQGSATVIVHYVLTLGLWVCFQEIASDGARIVGGMMS